MGLLARFEFGLHREQPPLLRLFVAARTLVRDAQFGLQYRNVVAWVIHKESIGFQSESSGFHRHYWEIFWPRKVCNAKCVPDDHILLFNDCVSVLNPHRNSVLSCACRWKLSCRKVLVAVLVKLRHPQRMRPKRSVLLKRTAFLRQHQWRRRWNQFVRNWFLSCRMQFVWIHNLPNAVFHRLNIAHCIELVPQHRVFPDKRISIRIQCLICNRLHVSFHHRVALPPIHRHVQSNVEQMLMKLRVHSRHYQRSILGRFARFIHLICRQHSSQANLKVNASVLLEDVPKLVLVIDHCRRALHNEFACSARFAVSGAILHVFPQHASIFFVHTHCVLQHNWLSLVVVQHSIKVVDRSNAIARQFQRVAAVSKSVIAHIFCRFTVVRCSWISIRNHHL
mmetsp:Transcript_5878/g.10422  ORF Transcript_5878/g.10422 Transcript_5878/m.10422 type:complete len:394 (-) Transcript_5878:693-1874(-)